MNNYQNEFLEYICINLLLFFENYQLILKCKSYFSLLKTRFMLCSKVVQT